MTISRTPNLGLRSSRTDEAEQNTAGDAGFRLFLRGCPGAVALGVKLKNSMKRAHHFGFMTVAMVTMLVASLLFLAPSKAILPVSVAYYGTTNDGWNNDHEPHPETWL